MIMLVLAAMFCAVGMFGDRFVPFFGNDMVKKGMFCVGGFFALMYFMEVFM